MSTEHRMYANGSQAAALDDIDDSGKMNISDFKEQFYRLEREAELRESNEAVKEAWERYQVILELNM